VAINDDESVRRLKGDGRPILAGEHRAELVAALRCVDYVVLFPEPTVGPLLEALRPDVHCKGTDYTLDSVPERDVVKGYGGRVGDCGRPEGSFHSRSARPHREPSVNSFLIVRLGSLGDIIHGIPVAAALRNTYPQAHIDWLVDPRYMELLDLVQCLDRRVPIDPRDVGRGGRRAGFFQTIGELRRAGYDACIDLQGLLKSALLARSVAGQADGRVSAGAPSRAARAAVLHRRS
jgi:hypothetical protein